MDNDAAVMPLGPDGRRQDERMDDERMDWAGATPFLFTHVLALGAFVIGVTWSDVALCLGLYFLRMFAITGGYHRYFSHRAYKTGRVFQFLLGLVGTASMQKGPLWWAAHHRAHHRYSDTDKDIHSPLRRGLWWAHVGWILCKRYEQTDYPRIPDFARYPEIRWLNRWHLVAPLGAGMLLYWFGGWHAFLWGGVVSSVLLWHGTFTINSLSHVFGSRRYNTTDTSKNNLLLALITMGEGWHNNHHHYQSTANQGFFWWEIDFSYYILRALAFLGIVWDLRRPPAHILQGTSPGAATALEADAA